MTPSMSPPPRVFANDSDVDGGTLSVSAVNGNDANVGTAIAGSTAGTFTLNGWFLQLQSGARRSLIWPRISKTPHKSATPSAMVREVRYCPLTVTVTGTNDAPVARPDVAEVTAKPDFVYLSTAQGSLGPGT
ncbi:hypothetical protein [Salinicola tamaricis]|uniref:hypothetical protein n=1 Tax=Salinicola tamaricis TaxID=1771309 RepID=UPI0013EDC393